MVNQQMQMGIHKSTGGASLVVPPFAPLDASVLSELLGQAVAVSDQPIYLTDAQWRIVYVNAGFKRQLGFSLKDVEGKTPAELWPDAFAQEQPHNLAVLIEGQTVSRDRLITTRTGGRVWMASREGPLSDGNGQIRNVIGLMSDITRAKIHETLQQKVLEAQILDQPLAAVMQMVCEEVERLQPETVATVMQVDSRGVMHLIAAPSMPDSYCRVVSGISIGPSVGSCGTAAYRGEPVLVTDIEHDPLWAVGRDFVLPLGLRACWSSPIRDSQGKVVGTFAFYYRECRGPTPLDEQIVEICTHLCGLAMERESARERIRQLANYDGLTGLSNRAMLLEQSGQLLNQISQNDDRLAVIFIDLDRFKRINEVFGHNEGDELLRIVAQRLRDALPHDGVAGRLAADEFVLVWPYGQQESLNACLDHLSQSLSQPCMIGGMSFVPAASIGVSLYPEDGSDMEALLHHADMAMNQAKRGVGDQGVISFYREEMNRSAHDRLAMENALSEAVAQETLQLVYQPQINLGDGSLFGVEALLRWHHPRWGNVPPARFIPLAEECGLIHRISHWVLRAACRQLRAWRDQGLTVPAVSVNLSPVDFNNPDLVGNVIEALRQYRLKPSDMIVEMTEGILLDTAPMTQAALRGLHEYGVRLAIDDFGTGYSSLSYLRRLPVTELKLDKRFVDDLAIDASSRALSKAVISIGQSLNLTVIAEGVEDPGQREILRQQGFHAGQGYLFARPLSVEAFEDWMAERTHEAKSQLA